MLKEKLESLKEIALGWKLKQYQVDTAQFNDPLADQIEWTPLKGGGFSFKTHKLKLEQNGLMAFKVSANLMLLSGMLILFGLLFLWGATKGLLDSASLDLPGSLIAMFVGVLFIGGGAYLYYAISAPIVFDKRNGYFYKGRKDTDKNAGETKVKHLVRLAEIHALQIIREKLGTGDTRTYSYELNLVLQDATRINIIDHGNLSQLEEEVDRLAEFLALPVWNAVKNKA